VRLGFKCPKCGGEYFHTISMLNLPVWTRQCRGSWLGPGHGYGGCSYTWESTEDKKHGIDVDSEGQSHDVGEGRL
jgi:hypothetical protein